MSLPHRISVFHTPLSLPQSTKCIHRCLSFSTSKAFCSSSKDKFKLHRVSCTPGGGNDNASGFSETGSFSDHEGSKVYDESPQTKGFTSNKLLQRLRRYGISGILSYGLLNTVYYLATFSFVWFYVVPTPGGMGYAAAVERFLKVMAMVWVGSQVTKLARAAGALALAPLVSKGLTWFTAKFKFESEGKAFMAIVGVCIGIALLLFFVLTLLWA